MTKREMIIGAIYLGVSQLVLPYLLVLVGTLFRGIQLSLSELNLLYAVINATVYVLILRRILIQSIRKFRYRLSSLLRNALTAFVLAEFGMHAVNIAIYALLPNFINGNNDAVIQMIGDSPWIMALETVILVPIAEECMFRGILFIPFFKIKPCYGYLISATAFAAAHVINFIGLLPPQMILLSLLQYIPSGLAFAWACAKTDSLLCPMIAHSAVNAFSFLSVLLTA